jgi:hypothetical protein
VSGDREAKFFYLDLAPEKVVAPGGRSYTRNAVLRWGPPWCFKEDHLYTTRFCGFRSDEIERRLFGPIDADGERALPFFIDYDHGRRRGAHEAWEDLLVFMDAQTLRTRKGLDLLKALTGLRDHNEALFLMQHMRQVNITTWTEGVWEVVQCKNSATKFIVSDHPVTTYNKRCFPGSPYCAYPRDAPIHLVGTHTIFPLGLEHCLVITNLEYVRDLDADPVRVRTNARAFAPAHFDIRKVQTGRELSESDVRALNYIIKKRARRYVAAAREGWLYPEEHLPTMRCTIQWRGKPCSRSPRSTKSWPSGRNGAVTRNSGSFRRVDAIGIVF